METWELVIKLVLASCAEHVALATEQPAQKLAEHTEQLFQDSKQRIAEIEAKAALVQDVKLMAASQAEDAGLWFVATTATEQYLQDALRRLHAAIERE